MNLERGEFRSIEMEDLEKWADDARWDDEISEGIYNFPIKLNKKVADKQGLALAQATTDRIAVPQDELYKLEQYWCAKSPLTHRAAYKHAIDFLVEDGTPILAARWGTVKEIVQHHSDWGDNIRYRDTLNYITLDHRDREFTQYCHVAQHSAQESGLVLGSVVKAGQQIGLVGKTGLTDRDHLHFIVFRGYQNDSLFQFKSLVPRFKKLWWKLS